MTRESLPQPKRRASDGRRPSSGRHEVSSTATQGAGVTAPEVLATHFIAEAWLTDRHRAVDDERRHANTTGTAAERAASPTMPQLVRVRTGQSPLTERGSRAIAKRWVRRSTSAFRGWACSPQRCSCLA
jgi:hypothetical protein